MPQYEAECPRCKKTLEYYAKVDDRDNTPDCCGWPTRRVMSRSQVMADIQPYRTVAADKETGRCQYISSRKKHREFLKRNGYEEVGNDKFESKKRSPDASGDFIWGKP